MAIYESTFVMLKPEVLERGLMGRVIQKLEDAGLEIKAARVVKPQQDELLRHYVKNRKWLIGVGKKALRQYDLRSMNPIEYLGTENPLEIGEKIYGWSIQSLLNREVLAMVWAGPHAVERVKQIVGPTEPMEAPRGTIRGDWCTDSIIYSNINQRAIYNLVHRSTNELDAKREIDIWFN